jgi:serine/threonine-protein phosphatase 2A regulatory subunit A
MDDEEEVLLILAEKLGEFTDFIGGAVHAEALFKPLERLCQVEESVVRDKVNF